MSLYATRLAVRRSPFACATVTVRASTSPRCNSAVPRIRARNAFAAAASPSLVGSGVINDLRHEFEVFRLLDSESRCDGIEGRIRSILIFCGGTADQGTPQHRPYRYEGNRGLEPLLDHAWCTWQ